MTNIIPYGKHEIKDEDIKAVSKILKSNFITQGPTISNFEKRFSKYVGSKYAIALSNGTAALHLCTKALGIKPGDKVITTPITFCASANCIRYSGGEVVFSDIDSKSLLLDLNKLEKLLKSSPIGTYKGIISVDFTGRPVNLEKLRYLADKYRLWILQDSCHSPGGYFIDSNQLKQKCGNGIYADLSIFSFHPVKHIACGEGGMITTNNKEFKDRLLNLRSHGVQQNPKLRIFDDKPWYYEMQELGFNYRLTDIQAGLGISQLKRAEEGIKKRISIAKKYEKAFKKEKFIISQSGFIEGHAYHLYIIEVRKRSELYNFLRKRNILTQIHYIPVHLMPYYRDIGHKEGDYPIAEKYYSRCLSLPIYPSLKKDEQEYVIEQIKSFYNE